MTLNTLDASFFFSIIDFAGVFIAGVGGALEARQNQDHQFDIVGVIGLGYISALGGGVLRDVLLQKGPPLSFMDSRYLLLALAGSLIGLLCSIRPQRAFKWFFVFIDAASLGLFAVAGSARSVSAGFSDFPSLLIGIVSAVGGGSLRDVFSGRAPKVFERSEPYALVATVASGVFLICDRLSGSARLSMWAGLVTGFVLRAVSLRMEWKTCPARDFLPWRQAGVAQMQKAPNCDEM